MTQRKPMAKKPHVCPLHIHNIITCEECRKVGEDGRKRGQVCEEDHYVYWLGWIVPVVCAVGILVFGYWFVSRPPIERPYPVLITKLKEAPINMENLDRMFHAEYALRECQSDYRAQRETIRILKGEK